MNIHYFFVDLTASECSAIVDFKRATYNPPHIQEFIPETYIAGNQLLPLFSVRNAAHESIVQLWR